MKFRILRNQNWMHRIKTRGMTLWPFILMRDDAVSLYRHELQHVYQIQKLGMLRFYWLWIKYSIKGPNLLEIEADERENDSLTSEEQVWWDRGVIKLP